MAMEKVPGIGGFFLRAKEPALWQTERGDAPRAPQSIS
jgi:hypothetical protein